MYGFLFDGELSDDYGIIMANLDNEEMTWQTGELSYITSTTPSSDIVHFYTSKWESQLSCNFSIIKNPCLSSQNMYFTQEEQSAIMRWLVREDGYKWLQFNVEEYEDVYFHAKLSLTPYYIGERIAGFKIQMDTDAPYAFSKLYTKTFTLNGSNSYEFVDYSDKTGYIYPKMTISPTSNTSSLKIYTGISTDRIMTKIDNVKSTDTIILDGENDFVQGVTYLGNFNFKFPVISNTYTDRKNIITANSGANITMEYRLIRMVTV